MSRPEVKIPKARKIVDLDGDWWDYKALPKAMKRVQREPSETIHLYDLRVVASDWRRQGGTRGKARGGNALAAGLMATIFIRYPRDGAGRLSVLVRDHGPGKDGHPVGCVWWGGTASGYGYDKLTAALTGCSVGGIELGDHCDHLGRPTLDDLTRVCPWVGRV